MMNAQEPKGEKITGRLASSMRPWLLLLLTIILGGVAVLFLLVNQEGAGREPIENVYGDIVYVFSAIVGGAAGALITARRHRNPIGWILLATAFFQVGEDVFTGYSTYSLITQPGALPGALFFAWLGQWMWTPVFAALLLAIMIYPTGQLLSPRWRIVAWAGMVGVVALLLVTALASELIVGNGNPPLTVANPIGLIDTKNIVQPILLPVVFAFIIIMLFASLASLVIRFRRARGDERQQLKWFTYAVALALVTEVIAGAVLGTWAQVVQNIAFLMLPLSVGIAILKYRLYDIDLLINRTLVYVPLTALLTGVFAASITLSQKMFIAVTGQSSDAATVFTTLVVVATFEPLKGGLQHLVDRRFKEAPDPTRKLNALSDQMRSVLQVIDVEQITRRVLDEALAAYGAQGGAIYLDANDRTNPAQTGGEWNDDPRLSVILRNNGTPLGTLRLGPRKNGSEYSEQDRTTLEQMANLLARAIALSERVDRVRQ